MVIQSINDNPLPGNSTTITVRATDSGGKFVEKQIVVTVTPVNDAPKITHQDQVSDTGTNNALTTADAGDTDVGYEDTPLIFNVNPSSPPITFDSPSNQAGNPTINQNTTADNRILITDPDSATLTVTLTATHGTLTLPQTTGLTFTVGTGTLNTTMTFSGSPTDIQNALGNIASPNLGLTFNPDANFNGIATLTVTASDGVAAPVTNTTNLIILAVNDDPIANPDSATVNQNSSNNTLNVLTNDTAGPTAPAGTSDNEASQTIKVVGINGAGVTTATTTGGGTATIGAGGTSILYTPAAGFFGDDTFQYVIQDNGSSSGTVNPNPTGRQQLNGAFVTSISDPKISLLATVTIHVAGINQSPRVDITAINPAQTDEDVNVRLGPTGGGPTLQIVINDDIPTPALIGPGSTQVDKVHLQAGGGGNAGTFTLGTLPGTVTIVAGANNTGDVTLQGPVNDINTLLNSSFYVPKANVNGTSIDTVTVTATDQGTPPLSTANRWALVSLRSTMPRRRTSARA